MKEIKKIGDERIHDNGIKMAELEENLSLMDDTDAKKVIHE